MKLTCQKLVWALVVLPTMALSPSALAQGSLTPSGAPAPTMKTLDQIEPRTVITNLPFTASAPGGYVVDRNLTLASGHGISVTASDVMIDLNGFVLTGSPGGGGHGILVASGVENVTIKNGVLRNWGADGVHAPEADGASIRNIQVYDCGGDGVAMNKAELIEAIAKRNNGAGVRIPKQTQGATFGERVKATGNGGGGIVVTGSGELILRNSEISGNTGQGISWVSAEAGATFRLGLAGVACDDNTGDGVQVDWSGAAAQGYIKFDDVPGEPKSRVSGNGGHGVSVAMGAASAYLKIDGVDGEFANNGGDGIHVNTPGAGARAFMKLGTIDGESRVRDNTGNGVTVILNAVNAYLKLEDIKGEFVNNGGDGMVVSGGNKGAIDLDGSDFSGNTQAGLILIADDGVKPGSVNRVNTSGNGSHGIHIQGSGVYRFSGCRAAKNGGDGIRAERPAAGADRWGELIFETNDLVGNNGAGLNIPTNATATVAGTVLVTGGLVSGNTAAGIIIADDGVKPGSVNRVNVTGNGGHGIEVAGHDFSIGDNLVARNVGSGIRVTGTGAHLANNQCSGNVTGIEVTGLGNAVRENIFGGPAAQMPLNVTTPGNAVAPTQDIDTGNNPLGNVGY